MEQNGNISLDENEKWCELAQYYLEPQFTSSIATIKFMIASNSVKDNKRQYVPYSARQRESFPTTDTSCSIFSYSVTY